MNRVSLLSLALRRVVTAALILVPWCAASADDLTITKSGSQPVQLRLHGTPNKNYSIESTADLRVGNWLTLSSGASDASGVYQANDTGVGGAAARFYRGRALAPLQVTTSTAVSVQSTPISIQLDGSDPLNPGGALTAIITQLPTTGSLQQMDGTPITTVGTAITDANHHVRYVPAPNGAGGEVVFGYTMRRESDGVISAQQLVSVSTSPNWVFSSFDDSTQALALGFSTDGLNWSVTPDLYHAPNSNVVRDSSIVHLNGAYYIAYTAGTNFGDASYVQICRSTDLIHWTYLCNVDTTVSGLAWYSWAPEWFVDDDGAVYLYISRQLDQEGWRIFWTQPTSADLTSWQPIQRVGGDMLARGAIDPKVVRDGNTYYLLYRNYGNGGGTDYIEMARGTSPTSFSLYKTGDWGGWGTPREAPSLVHLDGAHWRLYYVLADGTSLNGSPVAYSESNDGMATWTTPVGMNLPEHGTCYSLQGLTAGRPAISLPAASGKAAVPAKNPGNPSQEPVGDRLP